MGVMRVQEPAKPPISAQFVYRKGDYHHALLCYRDAQEWVLSTGAWQLKGLKGVINRPHHKKCPASCREVPGELIQKSGWTVTVDFYCDTESLEWLLKQPVPAFARIIVPGQAIAPDASACQDSN